MADHGRVSGERVYCHQCSNEWARDQGGLTCPQCQSEFTEIHESSTPTAREDPYSSIPGAFSPSSSEQNNLHTHDPWAHDAPDPDEDDITSFEFSTRPGGQGMFSFSATTVRGPGGWQTHTVEDPDMAEVAQDFESMLTNIVGGQTQGNNRNRGFHGPPPGFPGLPFPGPMNDPFAGRHVRTSSGRDYAQGPQPQAIQAGNFQDLFSLIFQQMGNMPGSNNPNARNMPDGPASPLAFLSQLMNPANAAHGDAVFSQEALDRVISQLMEQNAGSSAPPPASQDAIRNLSTKKVVSEMMDERTGQAECSICMDNVELGEDVTTLPCGHWFHGACVTAWLKEHDTCPHCRKGISELKQQATPSGRPRRASSVSSPRSPGVEGSRRNPVSVPESPRDIRAARQQYYERERERDVRNSGYNTDYQRASERSSGHSRPRSHNERRQSDRSSGGRSPNSGGVGGWIRNHNPFSG